MVLFLSNDEAKECLDMRTTIDVLERMYDAYAGGRAAGIPRSDLIMPVGDQHAYVFKVMPVAIEDAGVCALRLQSDFISWENDRKQFIGRARGGQHVHNIELYDMETTEPLLFMPDSYVSVMRVGATNGLGAKLMARADSETVGLLGAGRQAGAQLWAFAEVLDINEVAVYSPTPESRTAFAAEWSERLDLTVTAVDSAHQAVEGKDILACASNALSPIFDTEWIEPGMHISAIKNLEVPEGALTAADRIGLHWNKLPSGPNNYAPSGSDFAARLDDMWTYERLDISQSPDLPELLQAETSRDPDDVTLFLNNIGIGLQFTAVAKAVYDEATERGLGTDVDTELFLYKKFAT